MRIILNQDLRTPFGNFKTNDEIIIACDQNNLPIDNFWRNRFKDLELDNCFKIIEENDLKPKNKK